MWRKNCDSSSSGSVFCSVLNRFSFRCSSGLHHSTQFKLLLGCYWSSLLPFLIIQDNEDDQTLAWNYWSTHTHTHTINNTPASNRGPKCSLTWPPSGEEDVELTNVQSKLSFQICAWRLKNSPLTSQLTLKFSSVTKKITPFNLRLLVTATHIKWCKAGRQR